MGAARQLPPSADIGPGGQSVGPACAILLQGSVGRPTDAPWNAVTAFTNCGRAVAHVRGSYVPTREVSEAGELASEKAIISDLRG